MRETIIVVREVEEAPVAYRDTSRARARRAATPPGAARRGTVRSCVPVQAANGRRPEQNKPVRPRSALSRKTQMRFSAFALSEGLNETGSMVSRSLCGGVESG